MLERSPVGARIVSEKPYFDGGTFTLFHNDCLSSLSYLPKNSVDMIFADPPYNLSNGGFTVHSGKMVSVHKGDWDESNGFEDDYNFHYSWLEACRRVLKPQGTLWVSGTYHAGRTPEELAKEFEPSAQAIRNWIAQADRDEGRREDGLTTAEREELGRLRRENRQLKLEREILSKAAAWFARETDVIPPRDSNS